MVGLVIVSHSEKLAEGVKELAEQMGGGKVRIAAAGGMADHAIGTDLERVLAGIQAVDDPTGVLVLMDLGSAVLTAKLAVEMLPEETRGRVRLSRAPVVEGAIAAAAEAAGGSSLAKVEESACAALQLEKVAADPVEPVDAPAPVPRAAAVTVECSLRNPLGLHARTAALVVQEAQKFQADLVIENRSRPASPANARSLIGLLKLMATQGHVVAVRAEGADAEAAAAAVGALIQSGFGEI